jgi:hypothetical protein
MAWIFKLFRLHHTTSHHHHHHRDQQPPLPILVTLIVTRVSEGAARARALNPLTNPAIATRGAKDEGKATRGL